MSRRYAVAVVLAAAVLLTSVELVSTPAEALEEGSGGVTTTVVSSPSDPSTPATDTLAAERDQIRAEVADIDARIRSAEAAAAEAQARVDAAQATATASAERAERASNDAETAAREARAYAIEAFVRPPAQDALSATEISETKDAAYASGVLKIVADRRRRVVDTMNAARVVADREHGEARAAMEAQRVEVQRARAEVSTLEATRAQQAGLASRLDDRLDAALAEAAALKRVNARVADDLAAQEVALRQGGPASAATAPSAASTPQVATVAASPTSSTSSMPTAQKPATTTTVPRPATTIPSTTVPSPPVTGPGLVTWSDVTKVGGIWVNKSVASNVQGLLAAARSAGFSLSGGGYRDPAGQIAVRMANCGTSDYAIYQMPASLCTPTTARPGTSMHERGLAMDLQSSGRLITSRTDPAFIWLSANAARFGFYNLPSEPWHWSTNGN